MFVHGSLVAVSRDVGGTAALMLVTPEPGTLDHRELLLPGLLNRVKEEIHAERIAGDVSCDDNVDVVFVCLFQVLFGNVHHDHGADVGRVREPLERLLGTARASGHIDEDAARPAFLAARNDLENPKNLKPKNKGIRSREIGNIRSKEFLLLEAGAE